MTLQNDVRTDVEVRLASKVDGVFKQRRGYGEVDVVFDQGKGRGVNDVPLKLLEGVGLGECAARQDKFGRQAEDSPRLQDPMDVAHGGLGLLGAPEVLDGRKREAEVEGAIGIGQIERVRALDGQMILPVLERCVLLGIREHVLGGFIPGVLAVDVRGKHPIYLVCEVVERALGPGPHGDGGRPRRHDPQPLEP